VNNVFQQTLMSWMVVGVGSHPQRRVNRSTHDAKGDAEPVISHNPLAAIGLAESRREAALFDEQLI